MHECIRQPSGQALLARPGQGGRWPDRDQKGAVQAQPGEGEFRIAGPVVCTVARCALQLTFLPCLRQAELDAALSIQVEALKQAAKVLRDSLDWDASKESGAE